MTHFYSNSNCEADPTRGEMLSYLDQIPFANELDEFDREAAVYWFANDYHSGQSSNLYSALSLSPYSPGPLQKGVETGSMEEYAYNSLVQEFTQ